MVNIYLRPIKERIQLLEGTVASLEKTLKAQEERLAFIEGLLVEKPAPEPEVPQVKPQKKA